MHDLTQELLLVDSQPEGTKPLRKIKAKNNAESKETRQIENQKILRVLAASAAPLNASQIEAETGIKTSNLKQRLSHLCHQRLVKVAFKDKCQYKPVLVRYFITTRPTTAKREAKL